MQGLEKALACPRFPLLQAQSLLVLSPTTARHSMAQRSTAQRVAARPHPLLQHLVERQHPAAPQLLHRHGAGLAPQHNYQIHARLQQHEQGKK